MEHLCDDIVLVIAQALDIDTFLNYRCKHLLSDESLRQTDSPIDGLLWLQRLRYEYLAAVLIERKQLDVAWTPLYSEWELDKLDLLVVLALGWQVLARFSKLLQEAHLKFERRYNNPSRMTDMEHEERIWHAQLCRKWLDLLGQLTYLEVWGFDWLWEILICDLFQFTGYARHHSNQYLSDFRSVAWLKIKVIQLGPSHFWAHWTPHLQTNSQVSDELNVQAEKAWHFQRQPVHHWEINEIRCVERAVHSFRVLPQMVCSEVDSTSQDAPLEDVSGSEFAKKANVGLWKAALRPKFLGNDGTSGHEVVEEVFRHVAFPTPVDWPLLGYKPPKETEDVDAGHTGRRRRSSRGGSRPKPLGSWYSCILKGWQEASGSRLEKDFRNFLRNVKPRKYPPF
ncbi:hypothetical protein AC578_10350 [Pseudocercospora eumusae]|uniref:Uncharacterized protein n=1 Tax=Pseudocercospora eumusae TaxID=321146 RepID=A0A139HRC6_9PEZI|nr:hypothetical protein AC578_10350 [Pseudocercospora eumusae]